MQSTLFEKMTTCISMRATHAKWNVILYLLSIRVGVWGFIAAKREQPANKWACPGKLPRARGWQHAEDKGQGLDLPTPIPLSVVPPPLFYNNVLFLV